MKNKKLKNKALTGLQLLQEYKKFCKKNNKEISGDDFINNFVPKFLEEGGEIIVNL